MFTDKYCTAERWDSDFKRTVRNIYCCVALGLHFPSHRLKSWAVVCYLTFKIRKSWTKCSVINIKIMTKYKCIHWQIELLPTKYEQNVKLVLSCGNGRNTLRTRCCVKTYITQPARTPVYSKFTKGMVSFGSFPLHIQLKNRSRCVLTKVTCLTSNCPRNRKVPFICLCFSDYKLAKKKCIYEKKIFFCFLLRNLQPDTLLAPLEDINMENIFHCLPEIGRFIVQ